ncbi:carbamoyltransferase N-terminal domain-containing protein [Bernardetia sp. OM2101]|uniref:carbamoyltransferase N-terminal domain-containing protein n=1 Tax=Bernardetia sp. OM2101 TaxID=3344876 RepID=UPI0035D045B7
MCHGKEKDITILKELQFPHSLGLLYSAFMYYTDFKVNSGEYKLMGLAPYRNPKAEQTKEFVRKIKETLCHVCSDGSIWLDQSYFNYATGLHMIQEKKWEQLFGVPTRKSESPIDQVHCDLAIQQVTEEVVILMAKEATLNRYKKFLYGWWCCSKLCSQ